MWSKTYSVCIFNVVSCLRFTSAVGTSVFGTMCHRQVREVKSIEKTRLTHSWFGFKDFKHLNVIFVKMYSIFELAYICFKALTGASGCNFSNHRQGSQNLPCQSFHCQLVTFPILSTLRLHSLHH